MEDEPLVALDEAEVVRDMTQADTVIVHTLGAAKCEASSGEVDLALLDISLPDGKVFEVADTLREHATPYIFVSAYGMPEIPVHHRAAPLISKLFSNSDLRSALSILMVPSMRPRVRGTRTS